MSHKPPTPRTWHIVIFRIDGELKDHAKAQIMILYDVLLLQYIKLGLRKTYNKFLLDSNRLDQNGGQSSGYLKIFVKRSS